MKKIFVYSGYYEMYITDKEIEHMELVDVFDNVADAEDFVEKKGDWLMIDRDLLIESSYCWKGDNYDTNTFDYEELFKCLFV